jgi:hypothetical protein
MTVKKYNGYSEEWCADSIRWSPWIGRPPGPKEQMKMTCGKVVGWDDTSDNHGHARPKLQPTGVGTAVTYEFMLDVVLLPALLMSGALHLWKSSLSIVDPEALPPGVPCVRSSKNFLYQGTEDVFDSIQEATGPKEVDVDRVYPMPDWEAVDDLIANRLHWTQVDFWAAREVVATWRYINRGGHIPPGGDQYVSNPYYGCDYATGKLQLTTPLEYKQSEPLPPDPEEPGELEGIFTTSSGVKYEQTFKGPLADELLENE